MEDLKIIINENQYDFSFDKIFPENVYIGNKEYTVKLLKDYGNGVYSFSLNNRNILVQIDRSNGAYKILHNNFMYEAQIKTSTTALLEQFMLSTGDENSNPILKAPMPGMVIKLLCEIGDEVKKGDKLIIIEAMKMENTLASPDSGKVIAIKVKEGETVDKDKIMIELETD